MENSIFFLKELKLAHVYLLYLVYFGMFLSEASYNFNQEQMQISQGL